MPGDERQLLDDQIRYYRARASEYDTTTTPDGDPYAAAGARVRAALRAAQPRGRVLELAAGTGNYTGLLSEFADELTALDASPETLELNAAKVGDPSVSYRVADIFSLPASADRDVVFFSFWLSHVPPGRFEAFWEIVAGLLAPSGRALFVDEGAHFLWREDWLDEGAGIVRRRLSDGSEHRAVKVLWRADDLEARLRALGWDAAVHAEEPFYWGEARRLTP
jgi:demethylmenaquinone methyltransferase/2-methoxy-6-polyprenyl-1,4-benzoquinol methylase